MCSAIRKFVYLVNFSIVIVALVSSSENDSNESRVHLKIHGIEKQLLNYSHNAGSDYVTKASIATTVMLTKITHICSPEPFGNDSSSSMYWRPAEMGSFAITNRQCIQRNGLPLTRKCIRNEESNFPPAVWQKMPQNSTQCMTNTRQKLITNTPVDLENEAFLMIKTLPVAAAKRLKRILKAAPVVEVTKRSLRVQTWRKIQENMCGVGFNGIFNRIPDFIDSSKAAALLAETPEFKTAKSIKVNIDRALDSVKLQVLAAGKELYLPGTRDSNALYLKVECPADATEEERKGVIHVQDVQKSRTEILLENKVKFDLVVIGSVLVSRDGYRIGRGNGFADLDIGLLIEIGSITPDTVIATFVHDVQVVDNLPTHLFQKYDTPVDLIVTPTEVIRVTKRLPRPSGLFWEILSERRLKIIPVLQVLKENEEKAGKVITLKEENTDVESSANKQYHRRRRPFRPRARRSETANERPRRKRPVGGRRGRSTKSKSEASATEDKDEPQQQKKQDQQQKPQRQRQRQRKPVSRKERFCVKVTNIPNFIRVKDLKTELRKREVNPIYITWKGQFGKCYLHFAKRNVATEDDEDVNSVLKSLSELAITAGEQNETCVLTTELIKFDNPAESSKNDDPQQEQTSPQRIESVDTTTV